MNTSVEEITRAYRQAIEAIFQCPITPEKTRQKLQTLVLNKLEIEIVNVLAGE